VSLPPVPPLARRYFRAAVAFLLYGLSIGLHISAALHLGLAVFRGGYVSAHTHVILIGFVVMALAGVALWLLPEPVSVRWRWLPRACWWLLVASVLGRSTTEILSGYYGWRWVGPAAFLASSVQAATLAALALHLLARLRAVRGGRRDA
jgi:hypothetical protein